MNFRIAQLRFLPDFQNVTDGKRSLPGVKGWCHGERESEEGVFYLREPLKIGRVNVVVVVAPINGEYCFISPSFLTLPENFPQLLLEKEGGLFYKDSTQEDHQYTSVALKLADKFFGKLSHDPDALWNIGDFVNDPDIFDQSYNKVSPRSWKSAQRDLHIILSWQRWQADALKAPEAIKDLERKTGFKVERTHLFQIRKRYGLPLLSE
jgi:hypothetical protein